METEAIRSLYAKFIGYLSQLPLPLKQLNDSLDDESSWDQYNDSVKRLSEVSRKDYSAFLIKPIQGYDPPFIYLVTLRQKLGGLISRLHTEYFRNEPLPFSGGPEVVITQTQQQSQSVFIQMLLDVQSKIDEKLQTLKDGSTEKGFFQKLKSTLSSAPNIIGLIVQILALAKESGISTDKLWELFK